MQITEFVFQQGIPSVVLWPIVVGVVCVGIVGVLLALSRLAKNKHRSHNAGSVFLISGYVAIVSMLMAWLLGGLNDNTRERELREAHYTAQAEAVLRAYPSLQEGRVKLYYSSSPTEKIGNLGEAIANQGSFIPLGTAYERVGSGVESYSYVMTLNEDWTLEIFQATEGDQLVKVNPSAS